MDYHFCIVLVMTENKKEPSTRIEKYTLDKAMAKYYLPCCWKIFRWKIAQPSAIQKKEWSNQVSSSK